MSNLLKALACVADGLVVPVRKQGEINVSINTYATDYDIDEKHYLTTKDGVFVIKNINDNTTHPINVNMSLSYMVKSDVFGKPLAIDAPRACCISGEKSFIEFLNMATNKTNDTKKLIIGFIDDEETVYMYDYNLSIYNISTGEERDIRNENIPVSLLTNRGKIIYINGGRIHSFNELDFNMLREYGMC